MPPISQALRPVIAQSKLLAPIRYCSSAGNAAPFCRFATVLIRSAPKPPVNKIYKISKSFIFYWANSDGSRRRSWSNGCCDNLSIHDISLLLVAKLSYPHATSSQFHCQHAKWRTGCSPQLDTFMLSKCTLDICRFAI